MRFEPISSDLPNFLIWGAQSHGYSFVISQELEQGYPEWTGFTASWKALKDDMRPFGTQPINRIDGGPWQRFTDAEQACEATLKQLKAKQ